MNFGREGADEPVRPSEVDPPAPSTTGGGRGAAVRTVVAVVVALAIGLTAGVNFGRRSVDVAAPPVSSPSAAPESTPLAVGTPQPAPLSTTAPSSTPSSTPPASASVSPPAVPLLPALPAADEELAPPISIVVPRLGIDQSLIELGVNPDRTLEVPTNATDIGWWRTGPVPGEPGSAVIAAHVTWNGGRPAVFKALPTLTAGDEVFINRADGSVGTYQVTATEVFSKDAFPNELIYRLEGDPQLTLITCGGDFVGGRYSDNIVVFADLVADTRLDSAA